MSLIPPILFIFGTVVGSFLNVVILRSITGSSLQGRSVCTRCGQQLAWFELIPILSFIFLRGRCRNCNTSVSAQYPIVEMVAGIMLMISYPNLLIFVALCILLVLFVIDFKTFLLPDFFVVLLGVVIFLNGSISLTGLLIGAGFLLFLWVITSGRGLGFGDVKLMIPLGLALGPLGTVALLGVSFSVGAVVGLTLIALGRADRKTAIPFGPFLAGTGILFLLFPSLVPIIASVLYPTALVL